MLHLNVLRDNLYFVYSSNYLEYFHQHFLHTYYICKTTTKYENGQKLFLWLCQGKRKGFIAIFLYLGGFVQTVH